MLKKRLISLVLAVVMAITTLGTSVIVFAEPGQDTYESTWYFAKNSGQTNDYSVQGASSEPLVLTANVTNADPAPQLTVDATSGKFNNVGNADWCQINAGTKITVHVVNGSVISVTAMATNGFTTSGGVSIDTNHPFTYSGPEADITLTATGSWYQTFTVVSPVNPEVYVPVSHNVAVAEYANGTVEVTGVTEGKADKDAAINVAVTPDEGYKVAKFEVVKTGDTAVKVQAVDGLFTMPDYDVTIAVEFAKKAETQPSVIDYELTFGENTVFDGWWTMKKQSNYEFYDGFVKVSNMQSTNGHGAQGSGPITVQVPGPVQIQAGTCAFDDMKIVVTDANGNVVDTEDDIIGTSQGKADETNGTYGCNDMVTLDYSGEATVLTISLEKSTSGKSANARFWLPYLSVKTAVPATPAPPEPSADPNANVILTQASTGVTRSFDTIRDAVKSAISLKPQSADEQVVINVKPGDYEEQVVFPSGSKFITLQKDPATEGRVDLHWYYCTGYSAANCDLNGEYNPDIDWSLDETWNGYNEGDEKFTRYEIGQKISGTISYYDKKGVAHKNVSVRGEVCLGDTGGMDKMATLITKSGATDITIKDINIVNSLPVMVTQGEKDGHITPNEGFTLPNRGALTVGLEDTPEVKPTADIFTSSGEVDLQKYEAYRAKGGTFTPGESVWLARSSKFNERGHAVSTNGDRIYFENIRLRGNQDSLYASNGRNYFKNCDIIGGTDYMYGSATCVFDNCKLGLEGFSDKKYGSPAAVPCTPIDRPYGYLFWNCTMYNMRDNNGTNNFGGSWNSNGQSTYYNTKLDDNASVGKSKFAIDPKGWCRFNAELGLHRLYEYGTTNLSGAAVDQSKRVVNKSVEEGGPGMGTVIDEWQVLEFNPRNYFSKENGTSKTFGWKDDWDVMNFGETYLKEVDAAIAGAAVTVPEGSATVVDLPQAPAGIAFKWESDSSNAVITDDGKLQVIRPAAGEAAIETKLTLYAMNTETKYGDKKEVPVTINPTSDTENVFSIPVTVTQSIESANEYSVTITKNGALIKSQTISVAEGQKTATAVIENVPVGEYDVKVLSKSDEFTVSAPENGLTVINGAKGASVPLGISASKLVDETVDLGISYSSSEKNKVFDIIELAKAKGVDSSFDTSDSFKISYTLNVNKVNTSGKSFIDFVSGTPKKTATNGALSSRYVFEKLGHWNQLDMVDCSQGFSGSSDGDGQGLNMSGKFKVGTPNEISVTIDYKNNLVSAEGHGASSKSKTFGAFPTQFTRNDIKMAIYAGGEEFTIENVKVTYKKLVGGAVPTAVPTAAPTPAPTEAPTPAPTAVPTVAPGLDYNIVSALFTKDGKLALNYTGEGAADGKKIMVATYQDDTEQVLLKSAQFNLADGDTVDYADPGEGVTKVFIWNGTDSIMPLSNAVYAQKDIDYSVDFTSMTAVPVYSQEAGQGFVSVSGAIRAEGFERQVADASKITMSSDGASVTESDGEYLHEKNNGQDGGDYNRGGLIYRFDTGAAGAYHIEVEVADPANTSVAPTGMEAGRLTSTNNWDNCGQVPKKVAATWKGNVWSYDFATGEDFVEVEIEPAKAPTASAPQTVCVKSIKITPIAVNAAGSKPTIHILGDSTQKSYSFNETISSWGQTLKNYFDPEKVTVINYSMGGRAMKSNYCEGRFGEVLVSGKAGDYVFIHSAHNDETVSTNRFSRGSGVTKNLADNNKSYNIWLDMYIKAIKARGMTPVLVTAMPRTSSGKYSEGAAKPNGFNPDSPANMRAKAASDPEIGFAELYDGAKKYIDSLDAKEVSYIYNSYEAGETPALNAANGTSGDGTHYREVIAKQWCRIILQSIYDQSVAETDTYADKPIMQALVSYMPESVKKAAASGDWTAVYPEMASDISTVGVEPGAVKQPETNYYYRPNIEKALELGLLHKDKTNNFKPNQTVTVGEFARGAEKAFGLPENSLASYTKTYAELQAKNATASLAADETAEAAAGEVTITVQQPTGGTVTVYNESAYHTATTDITSKITADQVLGDNEYYTFTAPSEVVKKTDKNGVFAGNDEITTAAVEIRNNGTKQAKYLAKADGVLTLYLMFVDHKKITCENKTDGKSVVKYINDTEIAGETQANQYAEVHFNVEAGKSYEVYTNGGTGRLFGIQYASSDYPQSTETLTVNAGDIIRVVAVPDDFYINKSITVDGQSIASGKEATFKAEKNVTVSADLTKEPDYIGETVVASDAALTREVMAAILYDAYQKVEDKTIIDMYIAQNGGVPSPDDPNYDPNIKYEGTPYIPLTGWGLLSDKGEIDDMLFQKAKSAYNLGLVRTETGIRRGSIANGTAFEPKAEVTRAKAAKSLVFCFILTQPMSNESQLLPNNHNFAADNAADIMAPNADAPKIPIK